MMPPRLRRLLRERRGATAVEFAMIIGPLMLIIMATLDLGYRMYVQSVLQGAMIEAVRVSSIGGKTTAQVDQVVKDRLKSLLGADKLSFERKSYYQFSYVKKPEPLITDKNGNGAYDPGDCWKDVNPNGTYDTDSGKTGLGGGDDIFYYQVTATFPHLGPAARMLGEGANHIVTANTMMRNQPFATQAQPSTVCS